jgi:hypothetical protein|tara:strand:- start:983 stop:1660 length:678 start_codon:yes stop_codon:yes gene_type:complete
MTPPTDKDEHTARIEIDMQVFDYKSDLTGGSLMVRESRIIADLLISGACPDEWNRYVMVDNLLQKRSPASAKRNAQAIRKRLELLEPSFWFALRDGDEELATQVAFCAALERNLLLVEFIERVVRDAYSSQAEYLELYQWGEFLDDCVHRDQRIANWTDSSRKKMGQVVFRILTEMGYLSSSRSLKLQNIAVRPEIKTLLDDHYKYRLKDCMTMSFVSTYSERAE